MKLPSKSFKNKQAVIFAEGKVVAVTNLTASAHKISTLANRSPQPAACLAVSPLHDATYIGATSTQLASRLAVSPSVPRQNWHHINTPYGMSCGFTPRRCDKTWCHVNTPCGMSGAPLHAAMHHGLHQQSLQHFSRFHPSMPGEIMVPRQ